MNSKTASALLKLKEELDSVGTKFNGLTWQRLDNAMQAHASQQTASLRKAYELSVKEMGRQLTDLENERMELEAENQRYKEALERIIIEAEDNEQVSWQYVAENMVSIAQQALKGQKGGDE